MARKSLPDYLIRKAGPYHVEVAKFGAGKEPAVVYHVKGRTCDCPSRYPCKHQEWARDHVGEVVEENDITGAIHFHLIPV